MTQQQTDESEASQLGGLAGETVDAVEQVADSKATKQAEKEAAKADKKESKKAKKDATKAVKKAYKKGEPTPDEITITAPQEESKITPKKARNAVGVARVIAPALIPVIAPYAVRAAGAAREAYDRYQARRIGVRVDQLGEFTGRGAGLHARIAGLSDSLSELRKSSTASEDDRSFTGRSDESLRQLAATVRAAERMPATRRKSAHRAVSGELDQLEGQLLRRLGV